MRYSSFTQSLIILTAFITANSNLVAAPHQSQFQLPSSNGYCAIVYNIKDSTGPQHKLDTFYPAIYKQFDDLSTETPDLLWDTYWGIRVGSRQQWLNEIAETFVTFFPGSAILRATWEFEGFTVNNYYFTPYDDIPSAASVPQNLFCSLIQVVNNTGSSLDVKLFKLLNFHTGQNPGDPRNELIQWDSVSQAYIETATNSPHIFMYKSVEQPSRHSTSTDNPAENPWTVVKNGGELTNRNNSGVGDDRVAAFQYDLGMLSPGEETWRGIIIGYDDGQRANLDTKVDSYLQNKSTTELLANERDCWTNWHTRDRLPIGLTTAETQIYEQSLALLKMGQCRLANRGNKTPNGQILASLPPGMWNISWVRDAAYAIVALVKSGHYEEAAAALNFFLNADVGYFKEYIYQNSDYGVGDDYDISVCRYYGNGTEESDGNDAAHGWNPNIEFDNFGLFLWALGTYLKANGTVNLESNFLQVMDRTAENLIRLTQTNGLLRHDSSCWERHLDEAAQYAYSSIMAVVGLDQVAAYHRTQGESWEANRYLMATLDLKAGIVNSLVSPSGFLQGAAGSAYTNYIDAAAGEVFNFGIIDPLSQFGQHTLNQFEQRLTMSTGPGYARLAGRPNAPNDWYDGQEWVFIDLRLASAFYKMDSRTKADALLSWITNQAQLNFNIIPELLSDGMYQAGSEDDHNYNPGQDAGGDYQGASPMMGFGAGAYILAIHDKYTDFERNVYGTVTLAENGQTVTGAQILLYQDNLLRKTAVSTNDGKYLLPEVSPGAYEVLCHYQERSKIVPLTVTGSNRDVQLDFTLEASRLSSYQDTATGNAASPHWTTGKKNGIFTSMTTNSRVWGTLVDGMLTEIYYPKLDVPNTGLCEFIVTDGTSFIDRESELADIDNIELLDSKALAYQSFVESTAHNYRLVKQYYTDPEGNSVIIDTNIQYTGTSTPTLYFLFSPHLNDSGWGDVGNYVELIDEVTQDQCFFLTAIDDDIACAVSCTAPVTEFSNFYEGAQDGGLVDLTAAAPYRLDTHYKATIEGNIQQLIKIDTATQTNFHVIISFGRTVLEAVSANVQTRRRLVSEDVYGEYVDGWHDALQAVDGSLATESVTNSQQFWVSTMVLKALEDKTYRGAMIASMSLPWGNDETDGTTGYHKVWARDLFHACTALMAVGDYAAVNRALDYIDTVHQEADGSMPLHSLIDGTNNGSADEQLDETAQAIMLAYRLWRTEGYIDDQEALKYWDSLIKAAANFLHSKEPKCQDRWEEEFAYSPSTLAAYIAGLVCAAEFADLAGDTATKALYLQKADQWESDIEKYLYTTNGTLAPDYYLRVCQNGNPNVPDTIEINNGGGTHDVRDIISGDFLELTRYGLRSVYDPKICRTVRLYDQELKVSTPNGAAYYRYSHDGFGEKADGRSYIAPPAYTGVGRLWTLLCEERAYFDLARELNVDSYLESIEDFANPGYLLPEQVWDTNDLPQYDLYKGHGTGSATPLAWANAAYLKLLRSKRDGRVYDWLQVVADRYGTTDIDNPPSYDAVMAPSPFDRSTDDYFTMRVLALGPLECVDQIEVYADLNEIGGPKRQPLNDDGLHGDLAANDNVYAYEYPMPGSVTLGQKAIPFQVTFDKIVYNDIFWLDIYDSGVSDNSFLGGYWNTYLDNRGGQLTLFAFLPYRTPNRIDLYYQDVDTGISLYDNGQDGDPVAGDNVFQKTFDISAGTQRVQMLLEMRPSGGNYMGQGWPYLHVTAWNK